MGKKLNYAMIYGQTAVGLAREFGVSTQESEAMLAAHAAVYPEATSWITAMHEEAARTGEVRTLSGRRRLLPNIFAANPTLVNQARRQAVNTIIQGTAADLLKLALIRLDETLPIEVRMVASVHDSVLLEVPKGMEKSVRLQVVAAMETALPNFTVPTPVDIGCGETWAACKADARV